MEISTQTSYFKLEQFNIDTIINIKLNLGTKNVNNNIITFYQSQQVCVFKIKMDKPIQFKVKLIKSSKV